MSPGIHVATPPADAHASDAYCGGVSCEEQIASVVALVSGRWAVAVVAVLHFASAPACFRELQRRIEGITQKELSRHLTQSVHHGVVSRRTDAADGTRIHYSLTDRGHALLNLVDHLGRWRSSASGICSVPCKPQ
jgi:DNA-binding HxlR family transcriptional regulator